jgi:hypothetical protein
MLNDRLLIFEKDTIDADSVVEHSAGTNLDFFATRFSSSETRVIRALYRKLAGSNKKDTLFEFDALGNRFPVEEIVGINSIKRFTS